MLDTKQPVQVLVSDPQADRAEVELMLQEDKRSLLMLPIFLSDWDWAYSRHTAAKSARGAAPRSTGRRVICYLLGARLDAFTLWRDAREPWAAIWPGG